MILQVVGLRKNFGSGENAIQVLRGVNLEVAPGETVAILGASGSGKSTLLSLLAGLDDPTQGEIWIAGQEIGHLAEEARAKFRAQNLGIVFQQYHLMSTLTALENVSLPLELVRDPQAQDKAQRLLEAMGLSARCEHFPHQLSGGEAQRVALARAVVGEPALLLADEPSGSLDSKSGEVVMKILFDLVAKRNMTLILVTHSHVLAERCQSRYELREGVLVPETVRR